MPPTTGWAAPAPQAAPSAGWVQSYGAAAGNYAGQWAWNGASWVWMPAPPKSFVGRHKVAIILGTILLAFLVLVGGCTVLIMPSAMGIVRIETNSNGRVTSVQYLNGEIRVYTAPGVTAADGPDIACNVVRPNLKGTLYENDPFEVIDTSGQVIASDRTPCS